MMDGPRAEEEGMVGRWPVRPVYLGDDYKRKKSTSSLGQTDDDDLTEPP